MARSEHFRPSPVFLATLALFITGGALTWYGYGNVRFNVFLFVVSGWVVSLCLHEYFHALTAYRGGDRSVAERGYANDCTPSVRTCAATAIRMRSSFPDAGRTSILFST